MKNQIVASIAAIPFALGAVFAGTGAANAGLSGTANLNAGFTSIELSKNSLSFIPQPGVLFLPGPAQSGDFVNFSVAGINGPITFNGTTGSPYTIETVNNPFFDFGTGMDASITDGENIFYLETGSILEVKQNGSSVDLMMGLDGYFQDTAAGSKTDASGSFTFQLAGNSQDPIYVADVEAIFAGTSPSKVTTFSASVTGTMQSTPEPATLFGLGVVATGLVASRRKKSS